MTARKKKAPPPPPSDPRMYLVAAAANQINSDAQEKGGDFDLVSTYEKRLHALVEDMRRDYGEKTQTEAVAKLLEYANGLIEVVKVQNAELARREVLIREAQRIVGSLLRLCQQNGTAIPSDLLPRLQ